MVAPKRAKLSGGSENLQPKIRTEEFQKALAEQIAGSKPYEHGVINGLLNDELLAKARAEIFENIQFTEKETDIYKLNQTGDLLNLDGLPEEELKLLGSLSKVREALYSQEFRDIITRVTRCGPLSGSKFDLSLNNYNKGCHLLAHDDVIGTRVISFILYLLPPEHDWNPKWGGALQLYPTLREGVPAVDPIAAVPPQWNQLSFFKIVPGHSFHDVEEVYADQPRLSIQGWFHAPVKGEPGYSEEALIKAETSKEKSTLSQLSHAHSSNDGYEPERKFSPLLLTMEDGMLSSSSHKYLENFISEEILANLSSLQENFAESSLLKLTGFLNPGFWSELKKEIEALELERCPMNCAEVLSPWAVASPPHLRRYMYLTDETENCSNSPKALTQLKSLFRSAEFAELLSALTGVIPKSQHAQVRRFRPGKDYTLASVSGIKSDMLEACLSLTSVKWEEDKGGYDLIMGGGTDENDDPAVYRQAANDEGGVLLRENPKANEFILILRDPDLLRFVKYLSRNANGSRWDVLGEYEIEEVDEE